MNVRSLRLQANLNRDEIAFDGFRVRTGARQLFLNGKAVALTGKAFDLLLVFLTSGGRVLRREDLYEELWGERVVEEANLSQTVYLLRRTLDPGGDGRTFIETVPRIGYRFAREPREVRPVPPHPRLKRIWAVAAVFCMLSIASTAWLFSFRYDAVSIAARDADDLGEYHLALRTPDHLSYALDYFNQAERAAPRNALGYAGAACAYALLAEFQPEGSARQHALVALASASSAAALRRNSRFSRALAVQGFIAYRFRGDRTLAARYLERALVADPSDAEAHLWWGVLLMRNGDIATAADEFQTAHRLSPTSEVYSRWLARAYSFEKKPYQAIAEARETLRIEPDDAPAILTIAAAQEQRGDLRSALDTLRVLVREDPYERPFVIPDEARLDLRLGKVEPALVARVGVLATSGRADPFEAALFYLTIGRKGDAMRMLRLASPSALAIQRHDPRLLALL